MQKELRKPREDEPNVLFGCGDHSFHMFTDDVRSGDGWGWSHGDGDDDELLGPL